MESLTIGILFPLAAGPAYQREVEQLRALDPRVRLIIEPYEEPHHLHTARSDPNADIAKLRAEAPALTPAQRAMFREVDAVLALALPFDVREVAPRLKWVQCIGAGTSQLQSAGLAQAGIRLTSAAGMNAVAIGEFVVGRILQHWKHFREIDARFRDQRWDPVYGRQLAGATAGLIGLGGINSVVAARLKAFGVRVLAMRRSSRPHPDVEELFPPERLDDMLGQCDIVAAAVPSTPQTSGLMSRERFAAMRRGAFFCNVGRGTLVDEPALIDALKSGHLGAVALDVASVEPLPPENPLWQAPNLYLSYHCSTDPHALFVNLHGLFRDNVRCFLDGQPLVNEVDPAAGY
jgi:phosphoglycerate dehydrogenase-like enzyme